MSVIHPTDEALKAALAPLRPDPQPFLEGVRDRVQEVESAASELQRTYSPLVHVAAGLVPLSLLGGKLLVSSAKSGSVGWGAKLLGYLALPAVSIFLIVGAFAFGAWSVLRPQDRAAADRPPGRDAIAAWWRKHWFVTALAYAALPVLMIFGSETVFFLLLLGSFVALAVLLSALSKAGAASRGQLAHHCASALFTLAIPLAFAFTRDRGGLAPSALSAGVLIVGAVLVTLLGGGTKEDRARRLSMPWLAVILLLLTQGALIRPALPSTMQSYVESYDEARFRGASWRKWEVPARWLRDARRDVDFDEPRHLLEREELERADANPYVLGIALRTGLLGAGDTSRLRELSDQRDRLLRDPGRGAVPLSFVDQAAWVIEALVLQGQLSPSERAFIEARLQATWGSLHEREHERLLSALLITELSAKLGSHVDLDARRRDVYTWLLYARDVRSDGKDIDGGLATAPRLGTNDRTTWAGVSLMEHYGVPPEIDLLGVRLAARPNGHILNGPDWTRAATRWKIDALRGRGPSLAEFVTHERTLVCCILLVLLVLFAILRAPPTTEPEAPEEGAEP